MDMTELVRYARGRQASDIHISEDLPVTIRVHGALERIEVQPSAAEKRSLILSLMTGAQRETLEGGTDVDFAWCLPDGSRQRVNVFRCMGGLAATLRLLNSRIPTPEELGLPEVVKRMSREPRGLILVTGPTGSGKSTTLAAMVDEVNRTRADHILTIEDPVEYVYEPARAAVHQREVGRDVESFAAALRSALREDPDVILVGEMRDYETISAAVTAAETGHLVLSTLHTTGAADTIDRIIDACPPQAQSQMRTQLAGILKGVITQCLIPLAGGGGRVVATEVLLGTDAVQNLIRENKCFQLNTVMQSGMALGMHTLNADLARLVRAGRITKESALAFSNDRRELGEYLGA